MDIERRYSFENSKYVPELVELSAELAINDALAQVD